LLAAGGLNTLRIIHEFLFHDPPVPVVIVNDTGRTADLIAHILKRLNQVHDIEAIKEEVCYGISRVYLVSGTQISSIFAEMKKIFTRRYMVR